MTWFPPGQILVLPSRQAVVQERERLLRGSDDGVWLGPKVMSIGRLENRLIEEVVVGPSFLSDRGRWMIMEKLVADRISGLITQSPSASSRNNGLVQRILELVDEARLGGVSPAQFYRIGQRLDSR